MTKCPHCHKPIDDAVVDKAKEAAEIRRINEEYRQHNPSVFLRAGDPLKIEVPLGVIAGPLGFYGSVANRLFLGTCRDTKQEAQDDAANAADWISIGGFAGLQYAYWKFA